MSIKSLSDLQNRRSDVGRDVIERGLAFLAEGGYGSMAVASTEQPERIDDSVESALDAADRQAAATPLRYTHDEVFGSLRS